jgi:peptide/nickel transport system substrate-binding protein
VHELATDPESWSESMTDLCRRHRPGTLAVLGCVVALTLALGACGGSSSSSSSSPSAGAAGFLAGTPVAGQKRGGTLKLLGAEGFSHMDPGQVYFQLDYMIAYATQRSLYYFKPEDPKTQVPDLADGLPVVSPDNKTVTVKLKSGIRYGTNTKTAITGKEVTSADVKYAFERGLNPNVGNGYEAVYFPLVGADKAKGGPISGIETPDAHTIVFKLSKPFGATTSRALGMPITMPVPKSYAAAGDAKTPNTYESKPETQAFTGPYMISDYQPDKSITLVRNPQWDPKTDARPAYLDKITWTLNVDPNVSGRQIFSSPGLANGDTPAAGAVKRFATKAKDRITFTPSGNRYVAVNTQRKPFSDINVRKALAAALDRRAMLLARGGSLVGIVANHFLPPTIPGYDEAGAAKGTGADYLANPAGDPAVAAKYMKLAGFPSGKANGEKVVMLGSNDSPAKETAEITRDAIASLGFKVTFRLLDQGTLYSKYCQVTSELKKIDICGAAGWIPDFSDPFAMLTATFSGHSITPTNNPNPSLLDDPQINAAMDKGAEINDPAQRAKAWGAIDRQIVEKAGAIPFDFDTPSNILSSNVQGVIAQWNASWDLSYMSLK